LVANHPLSDQAGHLMTRPRPIIAPRLLTAEQAAAYLGYATTGILAAIPVKPVQLAQKGPGAQPKYDIRALDAFLDRLSGLSVPPAAGAEVQADPEEEAETAYDRWKATRAAG
jgi:hypothetical protein